MEYTVFFTLVEIFTSVETLLPGRVASTGTACVRWRPGLGSGPPGARADGSCVGATAVSLPASSRCSLAAGSGRTLVGTGVTVTGVEAALVEGALEAGGTLAGALAEAFADALAEALADALAEDDGTCAVRDAFFSCPLRITLALLSLPASLIVTPACLSGWYPTFPPSV